ncbi:MAG: NAD(P)H-binding protein [Gaiellaceae bacterium]
MSDLDVVTGAFSYTGRHIARRLLADGRRVRTLTRRRNAASRLEQAPLRFDDGRALAESLRGADVLYNTYWVRFERGDVTFARAIENTRRLFAAAGEAGVRRIVHLSVTNPSEDSPLPYFRGKAVLERELRESGLSHAIVRPTLIFGSLDILVNNIAWILRRLPVFLLPGAGDYRVQPVSAEDTASLAVAAGAAQSDAVVDAAGPEVYTFAELVRLVGTAVGAERPLVRVSPRVALALSALIGRIRRDVLLTRDELDGLTGSLLVSAAPPTGRESFREWVAANADGLGRRYVSELARNYRRA